MVRDIDNNMDAPKPSEVQLAAEAYRKTPENIIRAKKGRKCSDDRDGSEHGEISRFGGDGGYTEAVLGFNKKFQLGLTPEQVVDIVVEISNENGDKYRIHTDDTAEPEESQVDSSKIGCGHLSNPQKLDPQDSNEPQYADYEVDPEDIAQTVKHTKSLAKLNPEKVEIVKLSGDHTRARGVFINIGKEKTIRHNNGRESWYVIDAARDKEYIEETLYPALLLKIPKLAELHIPVEEFINLLEKQTMTTAKILANGFEILSTNADEANSPVTHTGFVGQAA